MKIVKHIYDGDFGCEESNAKSPMVSVTLEDDNGKDSCVSIEDEWLIKHHLDIGSQWPEYLDRICDMERILNKANCLIENNSKDIKIYLPEVNRLKEYYESQLWKDDLALDEAGELPDSLKRGVLSEDGLYNMLENLAELLGDE